MPHIDSFFNVMELFNEIIFVAITYTFIGFHQTEIEPVLDSSKQWSLGYITIGLIVLAYVVNFGMMVFAMVNKIRWLYRKIQFYLMKQKAKQAKKEAAIRRNIIRKRKLLKRMDALEFDEESLLIPDDFVAVNPWRDLRERVKSVKNIAAILITEKELSSDSSDREISLDRNSLRFTMLDSPIKGHE